MNGPHKVLEAAMEYGNVPEETRRDFRAEMGDAGGRWGTRSCGGPLTSWISARREMARALLIEAAMVIELSSEENEKEEGSAV